MTSLIKQEIEFAIAALTESSETISPQAKHEFQIHLRELLAIRRDRLKINLNEIVHQIRGLKSE